MGDSHRTYPLLDIAKLIMSFLVVGIHVGKISDYPYPSVIEFCNRIAVPFFFVASGFFIYGKAVKGELGKALLKYLKLYITWVIVYLPFAVLYYFSSRYSVGDSLIDWLKCIVVTGEPPVAWHLWYVHSLIVSIVLITLFLARVDGNKVRKSTTVLWIASLLILVIRITCDKTGLCKTPDFMVILAMDGYQNALFGGLPLILTGMMLSAFEINNRSFKWIFYVASVLIGYCLFTWDIYLFGLITSSAIVIYCLSAHCPDKDTSVIRDLSKYVFFIHLIIVFLLRGRIDNVYLFWMASIAMSLFASAAIIYIKRKFNISFI